MKLQRTTKRPAAGGTAAGGGPPGGRMRLEPATEADSARRSGGDSSSPSLLRSSLVIALLIMAGKATGFLRVLTQGRTLGATLRADMFLVAFMIPECIYSFMIEGAVGACLVPVFVRLDGERSARFLSSMLLLAGGGGMLAALSLSSVSRRLVSLLAPGLPAGALAATAVLVSVALWYVPFISVAGVCKGWLDARGAFAVPASTPLLFNLVMIPGLIAAGVAGDLRWAAAAISAGGCLIAAVHLWRTRTLGARFARPMSLGDPAVAEFAALLLPASVLTALIQFQIFMERRTASMLGEGAMAILNVSQKFMNLPVAVAAIAAGTVLLPLLSRRHLHDPAGSPSRILACGELVLTLVLPCALLFHSAAPPVATALFASRLYGPQACSVTSSVLRIYALVIPLYVTTAVLSRCYVAMGDTGTPAVAKAVAVACNFLALPVMAGRWKVAGVAYALVVMFGVNLSALVAGLLRRTEAPLESAWSALGKPVLSAALALLPPALLHAAGAAPASTVLSLAGAALYLLTYGALTLPRLRALHARLSA